MARRRRRIRGCRPGSSGRRRHRRRTTTSRSRRSSRASRTTTPDGRKPLAEPAARVAHVAPQFDDAQQQRLASELGMWVFLATEVMFFGGMIVMYTAYRWLYPTAFAH